MGRFDIVDTALAGVKIVRRQRLQDTRGSLSRLFCSRDLAEAGWSASIAQINHTVTVRSGTVRGLHFQRPPHAEAKLVNCLRGEVWDVAVDLRTGSPSFLQWHAERLSGENGVALLIPPGCAHGFQALTDNVEMLYLHSMHYAPDAEGGLHPLDPRLAIVWPLALTELSARDAGHPNLDESFTGVSL